MDRDLFHDGTGARQNLYVTGAELAEIFGVSTMAVTKWVQAGMPKESRSRYNLAECVQWKLRELTDKAGPANKDTSDERTELVKAQTRKLELESAKLSGDLVAVDTVRRVVNQVAVIASSQLDGLAARVAGTVAELNEPATIQQVIFDECRSIRASIADSIRDYATADAVAGSGGHRRATTKKKRGAVGRRKPDTAARKPRAGAVAQ